MTAMKCGNKLATLLPPDVRHWLPMLEDITMSPAFKEKTSVMSKHLEANKEWVYLSMDATLKVCLKLRGQASYRASAQERQDAPFPDDVAWRRLLTVRGKSGAVLPLQSEKSEYIVSALTENFTAEQLQSVMHIATDSPSVKFYTELRRVCPNLTSMMLDPVHLAIVYEYGHWSKRTPGSKALRSVLKKACAIDRRVEKTFWSTCYDGDMSRPLDEAEASCRDMILSMSMPLKEANDVLAALDCETPLYGRAEFIKSVAAICAKFAHEVKRKAAGPNKEIFKILWAACAPDRLEWLMNNVRSRHAMPNEHLIFLPSGTSSNEALHAEINSWSRSTNVMHRSTLALKLRYYHFIKLMAHYLATHFPLTHIVSESVLLCRALGHSIWTCEDWKQWCSEQKKHKRQQKAQLPLAAAREAEESLVRGWLAKRPAAKRIKPTIIKRTPLRAPRRHTLRSSGVKRKSK